MPSLRPARPEHAAPSLCPYPGRGFAPLDASPGTGPRRDFPDPGTGTGPRREGLM